MREGYILKSKGSNAVTKEELELINRYTRRTFSPEEIYVFSVVLCDNEIDRDFERFSVEALQKLSKLYLGKTGIFDHNMKTSNQTARIFSTKVETDQTRQTASYEPYTRLVAKAYLPRTDKNKDFILELDSGIKKEVSVGCAVSKVTCSVCGADRKTVGCNHLKGHIYKENGTEQVCCSILSEPTDAYEWSFVAVPAQREAGVIKAFYSKGEGNTMISKIMKSMEENQSEMVLSKQQCEQVLNYIQDMEHLAECGKKYREDICKNVIRLCAIAQPNLSEKTMRRAAEKMSIEDLKEFEKAFEFRANELIPIGPQLEKKEKRNSQRKNDEFKI